MDWSLYDNELDDIKTELENMESGKGERVEIPTGDYECTVTKISMGLSKTSNKPMVSVWMKIVNGQYKGQMIFYNQIVEKAFGIHKVKQFFLPFEVPLTFENFGQFEDNLKEVQEKIKGVEFALSYGINDKGFSEYAVTQIFTF